MTRNEQLILRVERHLGEIAPSYRAALLEIDRSQFVDPAFRDRAFFDEPVPLETPHGRGAATVSAPHMYVLGFEALDLAPGDRLLELGSGSGYGAALAAHVVGPSGSVTTVEVDPHLARRTVETTGELPNVRVLHADGLSAATLLGAHNKCWLTFGVETPPTVLLDSLREGSVLVAPVGPPQAQRLLRYRRVGGRIAAEDLGGVRFVDARSLIHD